jgi:hypothetical protein
MSKDGDARQSIIAALRENLYVRPPVCSSNVEVVICDY